MFTIFISKIIISCAYFRMGFHLYFPNPVGQTKYQRVIARNKRKARFNREFRKLYSFLPCIDSNKIDGKLTDVPLLYQVQLRQMTCQQYSPNPSSQQRSRQNTTISINSIPFNTPSSSMSITSNINGKRSSFSS
ncbi:unnamed protein product [Rotaria socialis]|uniref:Uncharacterized protein n=2 Tax=Rotaria socialis TaxID=392032 RepID=A0A817MQ44_9BILA|nr:unnamed protein product [Rotaria socialis]CAF4148933.1 unnamed protein product [Rotaria socialis]